MTYIHITFHLLKNVLVPERGWNLPHRLAFRTGRSILRLSSYCSSHTTPNFNLIFSRVISALTLAVLAVIRLYHWPQSATPTAPRLQHSAGSALYTCRANAIPASDSDAVRTMIEPQPLSCLRTWQAQSWQGHRVARSTRKFFLLDWGRRHDRALTRRPCLDGRARLRFSIGSRFALGFVVCRSDVPRGATSKPTLTFQAAK